MYYATAKEMEKLDALSVENGLEIRQMMELAGWHMLTLFRILKIPRTAKVVIVCGKGNKGGDGLSAARHLFNHGWNVTVILLSESISKDARHHLVLLQKMKLPILVYPQERVRSKQTIQDGSIFIDALIGYHLLGSPRGVFKEVMEIMNATKKPIIAYDLPSGVEPTTGECLMPCIQATATLSLALPKKAFYYQKARKAAGRVFVADIGIPDFLYTKIDPNNRPSFERYTTSLIPLR